VLNLQAIICQAIWLILALLLISASVLVTDDSAHFTPVEEITVGLFLNRVEITVIQHTFLKFDQSQKKRDFQ